MFEDELDKKKSVDDSPREKSVVKVDGSFQKKSNSKRNTKKSNPNDSPLSKSGTNEKSRLTLAGNEKNASGLVEKVNSPSNADDDSHSGEGIHNPEVFCIRPSITKHFDENRTCMLCCTTFENGLELQAHLMLQKHMSKEMIKLESHFLYPTFDCRQCHAAKTNKYHTCVATLTRKIVDFIDKYVGYGTPLTCIICEGKTFKSINHLIIHIVVIHGYRSRAMSFSQKGLKCPFCFSWFHTRNYFVIEAHALNEHLPEMVIKKQKLMHVDDQPYQFTMRHFVCYFQFTKYSQILKSDNYTLTDCSVSYTDLPSLIGHLAYAHYPLPSDFQLSKSRPILCNACLLRFSNRADLNDHILCSHNSFMRFRAAKLSDEINFKEQCDSRVICQFCWTNQGSVHRLQTHILVYHINVWRICGFCERAFCEPKEKMSPVILNLTMERHVDHHCIQLQNHFIEISQISQLLRPPNKKQEEPDKATDYFAKIEICDHTVEVPDNDEELMKKLARFAREESFDFDI